MADTAHRPVRLLLLIPRTFTWEQTVEAKEKADTAIKRFLDRSNVALTDSGEWYKEQFGACGTWESWIWETVAGRDYGTREPHFNGFVVYGDRLGRASAGIVDLALRNNRAVLALRANDAPVELVKSLALIDETDMVTGWRVETSPPY